MNEVKITLKSDVSVADTKLEFEREISLETAGQIMAFIAEKEQQELRRKAKSI